MGDTGPVAPGVRCIGCGYDLAGLAPAPGAVCPECAELITESLRVHGAHGSAAYLRKLWWGSLLVAVSGACIGGVALGGYGLALANLLKLAPLPLAVVFGIGMLCWPLGWALVATPPDRGALVREGSRVLARACAALNGAGIMALLLELLALTAGGGSSEGIFATCAGLVFLACVPVSWFAGFLLLEGLSEEVLIDKAVARVCRTVLYATAVSLVVVFIVPVVAFGSLCAYGAAAAAWFWWRVGELRQGVR